jgi:hypothetical protein
MTDGMCVQERALSVSQPHQGAHVATLSKFFLIAFFAVATEMVCLTHLHDRGVLCCIIFHMAKGK